jgi:hypothetical protein
VFALTKENIRCPRVIPEALNARKRDDHVLTRIARAITAPNTTGSKRGEMLRARDSPIQSPTGSLVRSLDECSAKIQNEALPSASIRKARGRVATRCTSLHRRGVALRFRRRWMAVAMPSRRRRNPYANPGRLRGAKFEATPAMLGADPTDQRFRRRATLILPTKSR